MLETQAEVDAIYTVLNHSKLCDLFGFDSEYKQLQPFTSDKYENLHEELDKILKK